MPERSKVRWNLDNIEQKGHFIQSWENLKNQIQLLLYVFILTNGKKIFKYFDKKKKHKSEFKYQWVSKLFPKKNRVKKRMRVYLPIISLLAFHFNFHCLFNCSLLFMFFFSFHSRLICACWTVLKSCWDQTEFGFSLSCYLSAWCVHTRTRTLMQSYECVHTVLLRSQVCAFRPKGDE